VPPLRERKDDILWLARIFLDQFAAQGHEQPRSLTERAERALLDYPWPGNVRELKHCIERACIMTGDRQLEPRHFFECEPPTGAVERDPGTLSTYLQDCERSYIQRALAAHDWQVARTAESLGISRKTLWDKARRLGIKEAQGGEPS